MNNLIRLCDGVAQWLPDDPWTLLREVPEVLPAGPLILPVAEWLRDVGARDATTAPALERSPASSLLPPEGVWLAPEDDPEVLAGCLDGLALIAIDFPSFRDGRGYSLAYLLRRRLGWHGELRAVGDVLRDQLSHMRQCGFDAFAVREDKSVEDALKGLAGLSVLYGRSAIEPRPLFRRR
ncbi:MAG: hypothetical protein GAK43_01510 [Stenotrophomonas maltophilia]|nr:MAG: hypothetical protein GAK43_01510 [Stenotrophomonas maltophilia]